MKSLLVGVTSYRIHDSERLLNLTRRCLASVKNQKTTFPYEILLSDQRSSLKVLMDLQKEFGFEVLHEEKDCVSRSWNLICEMAFDKGHPYALILNNDVELFPNVLEFVVEFAERNPLSVISSPRVFDFSAFLLPLEVYKLLGPFDQKLDHLEDWDYYERMKEADVKLMRCDGFKVKHDGSATIGIFDRKETLEKAREYYRMKWGDGKHSLP